jgi:hypothetical protein
LPEGENIAMKSVLICTGLLLAATTLLAQPAPGPRQGPPPGPPKSPAATESATIGGKAVSIAYSSPRVRGRAGKIFTKDGLISHEPKYPVWRAGANAATTLHTEAELRIGGEAGLDVPKGDYTLFVDISDPAGWVLIVNKQTGQWGMSYDAAQDLGRVKMTMSAPPALVENLKYTLTDEGNGKGTLNLAWENMSASVPIEVR